MQCCGITSTVELLSLLSDVVEAMTRVWKTESPKKIHCLADDATCLSMGIYRSLDVLFQVWERRFINASCAWLMFEFESWCPGSKVVAGDLSFYTQPSGSD